jgi:DNA repair protein RecO (recombination protein O)
MLARSAGKISALARGARKSTKRFSGGLGTGASGVAVFRERPGTDLLLLESMDVARARLGLSGDIGKAAHAAYALELCERLLPVRHPEPAIFDWLEEFLDRVEAGKATAERLRVFELGLLIRLGYGPTLDRCAVCGWEMAVDQMMRWQPARGGAVCSGCSPRGDLLTASVRRALVALARTPLSDADQLGLDADTNAGCRRALLDLVRDHADGPLRSLVFIEKMGGRV